MSSTDTGNEEKKPAAAAAVAVEEVKTKATGFVASVHQRLENAKANAKQKYLNLLDLLGSVTRDWGYSDHSKVDGSGVNNTLREFGLETGVIEQQVRNGFHRFGQRMSSFSVPPAVNSFWESCKKYAAENPALAMTILALVVTCALPVIVFLSFALITLLVTFIGFLCVEGTLLGIASVFLGGVLLVVGFFTLIGVSSALVAYLVVSKFYTYVTGDDKPQRYLAKLPLIGYLFANISHAGANGDAVKVPNGFEDDEANSDESLAHTD